LSGRHVKRTSVLRAKPKLGFVLQKSVDLPLQLQVLFLPSALSAEGKKLFAFFATLRCKGLAVADYYSSV